MSNERIIDSGVFPLTAEGIAGAVNALFQAAQGQTIICEAWPNDPYPGAFVASAEAVRVIVQYDIQTDSLLARLRLRVTDG